MTQKETTMRFPLRPLALLTGCAAVAIESLTGNGPVNATAFLTIAGVLAL